VREGARDHQREKLRVDRLGDEVVGAGADGADRRVEAGVAGEHDDGDVGLDTEHALAELRPAQAGHPEIGEDHVEVLLGDQLERVVGRGAPHDIEALPGQHDLQELARGLIVVDHERATLRCAHVFLHVKQNLAPIPWSDSTQTLPP